MPDKKLQIHQATARWYLEVETAFLHLMGNIERLGMRGHVDVAQRLCDDPVVQHVLNLIAKDPNLPYAWRCDLADNFQKVVGKTIQLSRSEGIPK